MPQVDEFDRISNEYFEWMYHLVCNNQYNKVSYRKLLSYLHTVKFYAIIPMDDNRRKDGISFRYRFGTENGYSNDYIKEYLDIRDCSVLEMIIALSFRVEEQLASDFNYGNRTGQWFWNMIVNLDLGCMNDKNFDISYCEYVVNNFLERKYARNGKGGLFTIENPPEDVRNVEIWCQFMWYLNEIIDEY